MAAFLPLRTDLPHYSFSLELEGRAFGFEFRWNGRAGRWVFSVYDADGTLLLAGRHLVLGYPLLARFADPRLPAGELVAVDTTGTGVPPGLADLGGRVQLLYVPRAELLAVVAS